MREAGGRPIAPPPTYYYRRDLSLRELLPAVGAAVGVGLAAFYVARLMLQRTPLERRERIPVGRPALRVERSRPPRPAG